MILFVALMSVASFLIAIRKLKITEMGSEALKTSRLAMSAMMDKHLDEAAREKMVQSASIKLFGAFFSILFRSALALTVSILPIAIAHCTGIARYEAIVEFLARWDVIAVICLVTFGSYFLFGRVKPDHNDTFNVNYSPMDRLLHRIAFLSPVVQLTAADIEKSAFGRAFKDIKADPPIFITSLPRAGTTLMLEVLNHFPSMATHTYRDMPFVMAPILWNKVSNGFKKKAEPVERAHGDGMLVGYDSPESFEEILWHTFYPEKYLKDRIELWGDTDFNEDVRLFFGEHMQKIIALRRPDKKQGGRYLSKNNGNIARLDLIGRMFPGAEILIPLRHPVEHTASLWRQHINFLEMQKNNSFIRRYMEDIGHFDLGDLHCPIQFPLTKELVSIQDPMTLNYWMAYWIAAFTHVLELHEKVTLISYEATCLNGKAVLARLCERLKIDQGGQLELAAALLKAPSQKNRNTSGIDGELLKRAEKLYNELDKISTK